MNPGKLRHRITIQQLTTVTTENGFEIETWSDVATVWSARRGLLGREYYSAATIQAESDLVYTIRFRLGITSGMRIIDGMSTLNIKSPPIDPDDRKKRLEIHASEVVASGS